MARDALAELRDEQNIAVRLRGADWPRSMFRATPVPDHWYGLVTRPDGQRWFTPAGEAPRVDDDDRLLLVRNVPLVVPIEIDEAPGASGNLVSVRGELLMRWPAEEAELAALARWLERDRLRLDELQRRFAEDGGRMIVRGFVQARPAAELVGGDHRQALLTALRDGLKRWCFECGCALERVATLTFTSDMLRTQQARERHVSQRVAAVEARRAVEAAAAEALRQRLDGLSGVLGKLRGAAGGGDASMRELLPALSPAERGQLLENLWRVTPNRRETRAIAAVAGSEVLWCDPRGPDRIARRVTLPEDLGLLRSIAAAPDGTQLLAGAANGVWRLDAESGEIIGRHAVPDAPPQRTGFNSAVIWDNRLVGTHSGLGCWAWPLEDGNGAEPLLEPVDGQPRGIRCATVSDEGELFFATDDMIRVRRAGDGGVEELARVGGTIHALAVSAGVVYVGARDGVLRSLPVGDPGRQSVMHRTRDALESIGIRRWFDLVEVVIPAGDDGVLSIYGDDHVVVRLFDPRAAGLDAGGPAGGSSGSSAAVAGASALMSYAGANSGATLGLAVRRAWVADDVVVMLNARRDRLVILNNRMPEIAAAEFAVGKLTGRSIQDACLVGMANDE